MMQRLFLFLLVAATMTSCKDATTNSVESTEPADNEITSTVSDVSENIPAADSSITENPANSKTEISPDTQRVGSAEPGPKGVLLPNSALAPNFEKVISHLFGNRYGPDEIGPADRMPFFRPAEDKMFRRMRILKPINIKVGSKVYPRHTVKGYKFASQTAMENQLAEWLNEHESSADSIKIGDDIDALKSPPILIFTTTDQLYMVQTSCMYRGEEWDRIHAAFEELVPDPETVYVLEIGCEAGKTVYLKR